MKDGQFLRDAGIAPIMRAAFLIVSVGLLLTFLLSVLFLPRPVSDVQSFRAIAIVAAAAICFIASRPNPCTRSTQCEEPQP